LKDRNRQAELIPTYPNEILPVGFEIDPQSPFPISRPEKEDHPDPARAES
jgi:hypothetical protein